MIRNALTFDVDWAPDWAIDACASLCKQADVPATFFVTHRSPVLERLALDPLFELGIHPNFLPGSSHGEDARAVMDHCMSLVPTARAMRTHALVQSSPLFSLVCDSYPSIATDVSLFLPGHRSLAPTELYFGSSGRRLVRLPYFWEDDVYAEWPGWNWQQSAPESDGLRIFDFHPTYVALNLSRMEPYIRLKEHLGARRLYEATTEDFAPFKNSGPGARTFLESVLGEPRKFALISEISSQHAGGA